MMVFNYLRIEKRVEEREREREVDVAAHYDEQVSICIHIIQKFKRDR